MVALALNFFVLGVSRVRSVIHAVAIQGIVFGALPLLLYEQELDLHVFLVAAAAGP